MRRRALLRAVPSLALAARASALPPAAIAFPRDHGSHPSLRTEWWYVTGRVLAGTREFGFQVTFFRSRVDAAQPLHSRFAAKQLLFAHAAITDVARKRLRHDQRIARAGFDVADAAEGDLRIRLRDWSLTRAADGSIAARIPAGEFALDMRFVPTQAVLLQGREGLSRKGPDEQQASYYYSMPHLAVQGSLTIEGAPVPVIGRAWLDHEWSEALLAPEAVGWDWIGMNLDDGGALTAFRLRRADGTALWDGGSFRGIDGRVIVFRAGEVTFTPQRTWRSPRSGSAYGVDWAVRTPVGAFQVRALVDDQELDSRASTGSIYWEGLSQLRDDRGRPLGHGYLEMTGYAQRLRM